MSRAYRSLEIDSYTHPWSVYQVSTGSSPELYRVSHEIQDELQYGIITPAQSRALRATLARIELVLETREEALRSRPLINFEAPPPRVSPVLAPRSEPPPQYVVETRAPQREIVTVAQPTARSVVVTRGEGPMHIIRYNEYGVLVEDRDETEEEREEREYQEWKRANQL
ncbi:hypothetical protein ACJQWK_01319 [Exserohilum turcicum]|uniref:Uncharacterized protein n=1 Tax=Exserohilum turcicum (strain 28A) TaxID=671987 RepID=R0K7Q9_EXST2|nr:uncharacterized protein SETTUDRAFT_33326 [Exserohilum turcica Et28A]EOA84337.1 hypothetical protein SETTUDRAFT_33326 [Exserohilum turcica Et28A]